MKKISLTIVSFILIFYCPFLAAQIPKIREIPDYPTWVNEYEKKLSLPVKQFENGGFKEIYNPVNKVKISVFTKGHDYNLSYFIGDNKKIH